jgi:hypothetical protein
MTAMSAGDGGATNKFPCRNCGHQLDAGTPICGNCGTIVGSGGPRVPQPLAAGGIRPGAVIAAGLVVALAVGVFVARGAISDAFSSVTDAEHDVEDFIDPPEPIRIDVPGQNEGKGRGGGGKNGGGGQQATKSGYRNIDELVRDLRAGGVPCSPARVDSADEFLATGSCQSNGSHVQINIYFTPQGLAFAEEFYAEFAFASVHDDNWWVSGETSLMANVQKALGGRLHRP